MFVSRLLNGMSGNLTELELIGFERRISRHMPLPLSRDVGKLWNEMDRMWVVVENKGVSQGTSQSESALTSSLTSAWNRPQPARHLDAPHTNARQHTSTLQTPTPRRPQAQPMMPTPRQPMALVYNPLTTMTTSATSHHNGEDDGRHVT